MAWSWSSRRVFREHPAARWVGWVGQMEQKPAIAHSSTQANSSPGCWSSWSEAVIQCRSVREFGKRPLGAILAGGGQLPG